MFSIGHNLKNICRCCHSSDSLKDLWTEYYYCGHKEVYETMLKETFDIHIVHQNNDTNEISRQICEGCILKLRTAHAFKHMVIASEEKLSTFLEILHNGDDLDQGNENIKQASIKSETLKTECDSEDYEDTEQNDCLDVISIKQEIVRTEKEDATEGNLKQKLEHGTRNSKRKKQSSNDDPVNSDDKDWMKITERRGLGPILRENSLKLLSNSTMFVFQWHKSRYTCFCCKQPFTDMTSLKEHSNKEHSLKNIEKKIIIQQNRLLKVEISSLNCKKCKKKLNSINELREHLIDKHNIKFDINDDLLVPFKLQTDGLKCQICSESFKMFRLLNIHINRHYKNHVCHICGASFTNLVFLNLHKTRLHKTITCKECKMTFANRIDKKNHDKIEHNVVFERKSRFPCPYCDERFYQENFKVQHLVEKHGVVKPEYKCPFCSKVFITRGLCNNHVKRVHMKEKKHECDICHNLFYTKSDAVHGHFGIFCVFRRMQCKLNSITWG